MFALFRIFFQIIGRKNGFHLQSVFLKFLGFPKKVRVDWKKEALFLFQVEGRKISVTHFLRALSLLRPFELCQPDISAAIEVWKPVFTDDFLN